MKDSNEVDKLLRLKKYETPGEDYFAEFAENFKERQRSELLKQSSLTLFTERTSHWFHELGNAKWLIPAGAGVAAMAVVSLSLMPDVHENAEPIAAKNVSPEIPETPTFELKLPRPDDRVPGNPERRFSDQPGKLNTSFGGGRREL